MPMMRSNSPRIIPSSEFASPYGRQTRDVEAIDRPRAFEVRRVAELMDSAGTAWQPHPAMVIWAQEG
jgi:hypothetical protein